MDSLACDHKREIKERVFVNGDAAGKFKNIIEQNSTGKKYSSKKPEELGL